MYMILSLLKDPILSGICGVLVGALLGHFFSLGRDKRKEFNLATESMRRNAFAHLDEISDNSIGSKKINSNDILVLKGILGGISSREIENRYKVYDKCYWEIFNTDTPSSPIAPQQPKMEKIPECKLALKQLINSLEPK